jgi:hypothetical protein
VQPIKRRGEDGGQIGLDEDMWKESSGEEGSKGGSSKTLLRKGTVEWNWGDFGSWIDHCLSVE